MTWYFLKVNLSHFEPVRLFRMHRADFKTHEMSISLEARWTLRKCKFRRWKKRSRDINDNSSAEKERWRRKNLQPWREVGVTGSRWRWRDEDDTSLKEKEKTLVGGEEEIIVDKRKYGQRWCGGLWALQEEEGVFLATSKEKRKRAHHVWSQIGSRRGEERVIEEMRGEIGTDLRGFKWTRLCDLF